MLLGRTNHTPVAGFYELVGPWRGHVREFTFQETCQILQWTGFEILHNAKFDGMINRRLQNPFSRLLFKALCIAVPTYRDSLLVVARKPADWQPASRTPTTCRPASTKEFRCRGKACCHPSLPL